MISEPVEGRHYAPISSVAMETQLDWKWLVYEQTERISSPNRCSYFTPRIILRKRLVASQGNQQNAARETQQHLGCARNKKQLATWPPTEIIAICNDNHNNDNELPLFSGETSKKPAILYGFSFYLRKQQQHLNFARLFLVWPICSLVSSSVIPLKLNGNANNNFYPPNNKPPG